MSLNGCLLLSVNTMIDLSRMHPASHLMSPGILPSHDPELDN